MAIRGGNMPPGGKPPNTPGSITQNADANIDRIGNISNVSKTVSNMQKDVKQRITETQKSVDEGQQVSAVQKSMTTVLDKLADTVGALSSGVKTITIDTAKATKDTISQYGKAISEDISFNKQNTIAMALAKSTPIYGYFVAKFMETDVFKKAAERMKASIGKVFGSVAGMFRKGGKQKDDTAIPKMQSGGFVKKGGLTELHAGEIVAPIEKVLQRIDDSISTTKDLAKITEKTALHMTTDLKGYIKSSSSSDKSNMGIMRSFIRTFKEVGERTFTEQPVERMARSLLAIQDILGAQIGTWKQVWDEMLANHPTLVKLRLGMKVMSFALSSPYKITRAFFRVRGFGGYRAKLSKAKNPLKAIAENMASLYVDLMWRLDSMIPMIKLSAQANRDVAAKMTGNVYPRVKGVPKEKRRSIAGVVSNTLTAAPSLALQGMGGMLGMGGRALGGKFGKGMGAVGKGMGAVGRGLFWDAGKKKTKKEMAAGAIGESKGGGGDVIGIEVTDSTLKEIKDQLIDYYTEKLPLEFQFKELQNELTYKMLVAYNQNQEDTRKNSDVLALPYEAAEKQIEELDEQKKGKKKEKKRKKLIDKGYQSMISMSSRLRKYLTKDRIMRWLIIAGGFISAAFSTIGTVIGGLFATGGAIMTAIMGLGPVIMTALGTAAFWLPVLAALGGAGIGTAINKWVIAPWIAKKEKEKRERQAKAQKKQDTNYKEAIKQSQIKPKSEADTKALAGQHMGKVRRKLHRIGVSAEAQKQMQGIGFYGEPEIHDIQQGMHQYRQENIHKYLLYDPDGIAVLRKEFDSNPNSVRTRNMLRGESGIEYGMFRERVFLAWLNYRGDKYKIAKDLKSLGPELSKRATQKRQLAEIRRQQQLGDRTGTKEEMMLRGKRTGLVADIQRKKIEYETKLFQKLNQAKGVSKNWMTKLDSKSKAAFQEAKKYYTEKLGMTDAEADAEIQKFAMKVSDRYGVMINPDTYKTFATGVGDEVRERIPQAQNKLKMIAGEVELVMADGKKVAVENAKALKEHADTLVDAGMKQGAKTGGQLIQATTNIMQDVKSSQAVTGAMTAAERAGRDFYDEVTFDGDMD